MMASSRRRLAGLPQPTLSKSHGSRGFSISGLPGLTSAEHGISCKMRTSPGEFSFYAKIANSLTEGAIGTHMCCGITRKA